METTGHQGPHAIGVRPSPRDSAMKRSVSVPPNSVHEDGKKGTQLKSAAEKKSYTMGHIHEATLNKTGLAYMH